MEGDATQLKAKDFKGLDKYLTVSDEEIEKNEPRSMSLYESNFDNYRKPTNFVINTRKITPDNDFDFNQKAKFTIPRYGDKISDMMLEITLPTLPNVGYINTIGYGLIEYVELEIAGTSIVKHYDTYLDIHDKLMVQPGYRDGLNEMVLRFEEHTDDSFRGGTIYVPLKFWFCESLQQSFPLIALSHQDLVINVKLRPLASLWKSDDSSTLTTGNYNIESAYLLIDYIKLNKLERQLLKEKKEHRYLIKQVQQITETALDDARSIRVSLDSLNYPVVELIWVYQNDDNVTGKDYFNYSASTTVNDDPMLKARISFTEKDRLEEMNSKFFRMIQPFKKHSFIPDDYIYLYSFSPKPELEGQPAGTCNFSQLDDVYLHLTMRNNNSPGKIILYAINYNILIIEGGSAWLEKCLGD